MSKTENHQWDLQRFSEGAKEGDPPETFEFEVEGEKLSLPVKAGDVDLRGVLNKITRKASAPNKKMEQMTKELDTLKTAIHDKDSTNETLQAKLEEIEMEKLSVEEKAKVQFQKEMDKAAKIAHEKEEESNRWRISFQNEKINNEIGAALSGYDITNMSQVVWLMKEGGKAAIVEEDGNFRTVLKFEKAGAEEEMSPKDAAAHFLGQPENSHFLKNNLRPGGGTSKGGSIDANGNLIMKQEDMQDPEKRKQMREAIKDGKIPQFTD